MTTFRRSYRGLVHLILTGFMLLAATSGAVAQISTAELGEATDVAFKARFDGTDQHYVIRLPQKFDRREPHDVLIALHGHGSDRWQFANDQRDECRAARDAASKYQMIFVSPDYRAKTSWMGPAATADMLQIIDDLHLQFRIENVIISGGSMGGTSALAFAAMHPQQIDGVVSLNGTANLLEYQGFSDAISASFGGTKAEKADVYRVRSAELFPERLTMPVSLTTGARDTIVPPDSVLRLAEKLRQQKSPLKLIHRPEGGHETSHADGMDAFGFVIKQARKGDALGKPLLEFGATPRKIVCIGDSVTGVYYHTGGRRAYPEMLEVGLRQLYPDAAITVVNAGISGETTQDGLRRFERDVLNQKPDLVTISFCLNDVTRVPPEVYRANLESLIQQCQEHQSQVVLCTPNAVIDTAPRPISKLDTYCEILRDVARQKSVPVCDQYQAGTRFKTRAPWAWRLTLSDEIHPNMDGHKRMAEELCRTIAGKMISLDPVGPPSPSLPRLRLLLKQSKPIRVLAVPPYDSLIERAIKLLQPDASVEVTAWPAHEQTITAWEQQANKLVRSLKPDLVVLTVPREAVAATDEQFVRSFSWTMNWSLSFGLQEWDCVVVHPSVTEPGAVGPRDELFRHLVHAQDLDLIDRPKDDQSTTSELFSKWLRDHVNP